MGSRNAQRRQAKAVRRKKLLAERRRLEAADSRGSVVQDVRRTRTAPLHSCLVQRGIFESGFGMVLLTRKIGVGKFGLAAFLVDAFCLGVKDAFFRETEEAKINSFVESFEKTTPFEAADLSYARKLLHEAVAYARSLGLEPHADYAAVEPFSAMSPPRRATSNSSSVTMGSRFTSPVRPSRRRRSGAGSIVCADNSA